MMSELRLHGSKDPGKEKHLPVIEYQRVDSEKLRVKVIVGKERSHPNEPQHNISWIEIYFQPHDGEALALARIELQAHGENQAYTEPEIEITVRLPRVPGKLVARAYCTLHGVWESSVELE